MRISDWSSDVCAKDGFGAVALHDDTLTINNTASYTGSQGGPIGMTVGPDGTVRVNALINYSTTGTLTKQAGTIQYHTTEGSGNWFDMTSEETGRASCREREGQYM